MKSCYTCQSRLDCDCCFPGFFHDINCATQKAVRDKDFRARASILSALQTLGDAIGEACRDYRELVPTVAAAGNPSTGSGGVRNEERDSI